MNFFHYNITAFLYRVITLLLYSYMYTVSSLSRYKLIRHSPRFTTVQTEPSFDEHILVDATTNIQTQAEKNTVALRTLFSLCFSCLHKYQKFESTIYIYNLTRHVILPLNAI